MTPLDFFADDAQDTAGAATPRRAAQPPRGSPNALCQQQLRRQHRTLRFTKQQSRRTAHEFDLAQRSFVGAKQALVLPTPSIETARPLARQALAIKDVGEQPHVAAFLLALLAAHPPALAQAKTDLVPDVWQGDVLRPKPEMPGMTRLRFVTDSDYPPFHYFDEEGVLTGFNVDLARAICEALSVECEVNPVDWEDLFKNLDDGEADAAIASIRIDAESLKRADFTSRYYATPGRFIARKDNDLKDVRPETVEGRKIGVLKGTGHEAFLKQYFSAAELVPFVALCVVTDGPDDELPQDIQFLLARKSPAGKAGALAGTLLRRPSHLKQLWKMKETALAAAETLAQWVARLAEDLPD